MVVFGSILFWGFLGFFIPKKYMRAYMIVASVGISSLYFFYQPPVIYDLYRHYEILDILRKYDIWTVINGTIKENNSILESYREGSTFYLLYAYLIGLFRVNQLLPVISGIITYVSVSHIILMASEDIGEDTADWKIAFCFFFLLAMLDFRTISGIRNMMCYALFAHVLYKDLVRNAGKLPCFAAYLVLANIHSSIFIMIIIRIALELIRFVPKFVLLIAALLAFSFIDVILVVAARFSSISMVQAFIDKLYQYGFGGGSAYILYRGAIRLFFTVFFLLLYFYCKNNIQKAERYQRFGDFFLLFTMFALGSIRQYDTFVRSNIFMYFAILPFLLMFLQYAVAETPLELIVPDTSRIGFAESALYLLVYIVMMLSFAMYLRGYYLPMDPGFGFDITMLVP